MKTTQESPPSPRCTLRAYVLMFTELLALLTIAGSTLYSVLTETTNTLLLINIIGIAVYAAVNSIGGRHE